MHLLFEDPLGFSRNLLATVFLNQITNFIRFIIVPLDRTSFVPKKASAEIVMLKDLALAELGMKFGEHALGLGVIAVRCEAHRFAFAIAVPPTQRLGYVAVKEANGCRKRKSLKQFDLSVFPTPEGDGHAVT